MTQADWIILCLTITITLAGILLCTLVVLWPEKNNRDFDFLKSKTP